MKTPLKQALADRRDRADELLASGHQADMIFRPGQRALSLRAAKLWHVLVKAAGVELAARKDHSIPLATLYQSGIGHMTQAERIDALRELQTTLVEVRVPSPKVKGRTRVISEALLGKVERDEDDRGDLVWRFGDTLRRVFADSPHWAVLSKRAVMAFESRYSLRLYEIIALRSGLDHIHAETFPLENLRSRLGIPPGKLVRWQDVKVRALDPAIAEVNQLAGFTVRYEVVKQGRAVASVRLIWEEKAGRMLKATQRELDGSKVGRKARRAGTVETITGASQRPVRGQTASGRGNRPSNRSTALPDGSSAVSSLDEFPAGTIRYTDWAEVADAELPRGRNKPDIDLVAERFRQWAKSKGIPLRGPKVLERFETFCLKWKIRP